MKRVTRGSSPTRAATAKTASVPAPVGGLNARDSIANMPETDALTLDNWFCSPSSVDSRLGSQNWATGMSGAVETIATYNGVVSRKMFAVNSGNIYNVTVTGAVGAPVITGLSNNRFQYVNFGTPGGHFMQMVNGANHIQMFDGTTWSNPTITGLDDTTVVGINVFKSRIWYIPNNSLTAYYLPLNSIQGAATPFDFGSLFRLGGYLMAMITWTIDNANGVADYASFVSSEGEVLLYQGSDPAFASTWSLVGVFRIGRPIGRRCYAKVGSDVVLITTDGAFPISKALLTDRSQQQDALSNKIVNLISNDVQSYNGNFGWQPFLFPLGNKFIINVPQTANLVQYQYVMNTITGAWSRFVGMNANCWEMMGDQLFFGSNSGTVVQAETGTNDNGSNITLFGKPAFSYFGSPGDQKMFSLVRPILISEGIALPSIALNVDFEDVPPMDQGAFSGSSGSAWDISPWDTTPWGGSNNTLKDWQSAQGIGYSGTINMRFDLNGIGVSWQSTDYVLQVGGVL